MPGGGVRKLESTYSANKGNACPCTPVPPTVATAGHARRKGIPSATSQARESGVYSALSSCMYLQYIRISRHHLPGVNRRVDDDLALTEEGVPHVDSIAAWAYDGIR